MANRAHHSPSEFSLKITWMAVKSAQKSSQGKGLTFCRFLNILPRHQAISAKLEDYNEL